MRRYFHLAGMLVFLACFATTPLAADSIDQQSGFTPGFSGIGLGSGGFIAQTFTAGVTATLSGVSVSTFGGGGPYSLSIYTTNLGGTPGATLLASTSVGGGNSFGVEIVFPLGFVQLAGTTYAIVLQVGAGSNFWQMAGSGEQYVGGHGYISFDGTTWIILSSVSSAEDFAFQTYVTPLLEPVPEPGTLLLMGTGLVGLGAALRRKLLEPRSH